MERFELPEGWEWRKFKDVIQIGKGSLDPTHYLDEQFDLYSIPAFDKGREPEIVVGKLIGSLKTIVSERDCLFSKLNPRIPRVWIVGQPKGRTQISSTEFWPLRNRLAISEKGYLNPEYMQWIFQWEDFLDSFRGNVSGGVQSRQRLKKEDLQDIWLPIPPLPEQNRLVARIEAFAQRLEASRKEQQEAISTASAYFNLLCQRTYRELLETCITISLRESGNIIGGGTPSKDNATFWKGDIPWIAPKEMKRWHIGESSLTITETAINQSAAHLIPAPAVLFVVRGMILARTVPVAISTCSLTVNQDMKAIVPRQKLSAEFLAYMLLGAQPELLSMVEVAGHGTRKLESDRWGSLPIPLPDSSKQALIVQRLETMRRKADELTAVQRATESDLAALMPAILAKAFRGEL